MREISHLRELTAATDQGLAQRINDMNLRWEQRYEASDKAIETALSSAKEAVAAALIAAEKAVAKAEAAAEKRFDSLVDKLDDYRISNDKVVADLGSRVIATKGRSEGISAGWVILVAVVSVAAALIVIFNGIAG